MLCKNFFLPFPFADGGVLRLGRGCILCKFRCMEEIQQREYPGLSVTLIPHDSNVFYLLQRNGAALVIDPPVALPVLQLLQETGARLTRILVTHHDHDHVGGVTELASSGAAIEIPSGSDRTFSWEYLEIQEINTPGHRREHSAYYLAKPPPGLLFSGDCLFAGGCGRIHGLPPEWMYASLRKLAALPDDTHIYCGHDYLESNLTFARMLEPANEAIIHRLESIRAGESTLPSTIAWEKATNPFMRARSVNEFAERRARKDRF